MAPVTLIVLVSQHDVPRSDVERFKGAPFHAPMRRLDETRAARQPVLRWTAPEGSNIAAE